MLAVYRDSRQMSPIKKEPLKLIRFMMHQIFKMHDWNVPLPSQIIQCQYFLYTTHQQNLTCCCLTFINISNFSNAFNKSIQGHIFPIMIIAKSHKMLLFIEKACNEFI